MARFAPKTVAWSDRNSQEGLWRELTWLNYILVLPLVGELEGA
ncbi:MAG: hypothetical protein ACK5L5_05490 [Bacteroidales bacterium]